jgi:hypothetical protein
MNPNHLPTSSPTWLSKWDMQGTKGGRELGDRYPACRHWHNVAGRGLNTACYKGLFTACGINDDTHTAVKNVSDGLCKQQLEPIIKNRLAVSQRPLHILQVAVVFWAHVEFVGVCGCSLIVKWSLYPS